LQRWCCWAGASGLKALAQAPVAAACHPGAGAANWMPMVADTPSAHRCWPNAAQEPEGCRRRLQLRLEDARKLARDNPAGGGQYCQGVDEVRHRPDPVSQKHTMSEDGLQRRCHLLMSLGEAEAAEVFKHLSPKEVQKLGEAIAADQGVSRERVDKVVDRFTGVAASQSLLVSDTGDYVRAVLKRPWATTRPRC
jgi:hypothetical protein